MLEREEATVKCRRKRHISHISHTHSRHARLNTPQNRIKLLRACPKNPRPHASEPHGRIVAGVAGEATYIETDRDESSRRSMTYSLAGAPEGRVSRIIPP